MDVYLLAELFVGHGDMDCLVLLRQTCTELYSLIDSRSSTLSEMYHPGNDFADGNLTFWDCVYWYRCRTPLREHYGGKTKVSRFVPHVPAELQYVYQMMCNATREECIRIYKSFESSCIRGGSYDIHLNAMFNIIIPRMKSIHTVIDLYRCHPRLVLPDYCEAYTNYQIYLFFEELERNKYFNIVVLERLRIGDALSVSVAMSFINNNRYSKPELNALLIEIIKDLNSYNDIVRAVFEKAETPERKVMIITRLLKGSRTELVDKLVPSLRDISDRIVERMMYKCILHLQPKSISYIMSCRKVDWNFISVELLAHITNYPKCSVASARLFLSISHVRDNPYDVLSSSIGTMMFAVGGNERAKIPLYEYVINNADKSVIRWDDLHTFIMNMGGMEKLKPNTERMIMSADIRRNGQKGIDRWCSYISAFDKDARDKHNAMKEARGIHRYK